MKPLLLNKITDYPNSGLGRITTATNQDVHTVLNGDYTFTFNMLVTDKLFSKLKEEMIVSTSVSVNDTDFFYIKNIDVKNPGTVTVTCNHVTMLTNESFVRGKLTIDGKTAKSVISEMVSKLDLPSQRFTYRTDIEKTIGTTDITYTNANPGQILIGDNNSLVHVLDARLVRKGITLTLTDRNTGRYIDLRRGKNISGVSINRNIDNLKTSIVPYFTMKSKDVTSTDDGSSSGTSTNTAGWTIKSISDGKVTITSVFGMIYSDGNTPVTNRALAKGTVWKTDMRREKLGVYQFRVATNMWVLSSDVNFDGTIGEIVSQPTQPSKPASVVPENQIQYGPEVYSPLYDSSHPHRMYVDYSSRVDNIPDLIDVSNKYFVENPTTDKPVYTIDIEVSKANQKRVVDADVGDIARIYDPKYGIESNETIIERHFDPDLNSNKSLKAGVFQQTIFRYLDKRIKDSSKKTDEIKSQSDTNLINAQVDLTEADGDLKDQIDESEKKAQDLIAQVKNTVSQAQNSITNFMNSGGNNFIRWIPTLAEATQMEISTPYGYWLLDDHGAGFHSHNGTVMTGLSADGRVYADSIVGNSLTGTTITGGTVTGGYVNGAKITGGSIEGAVSIRLNSNGSVTTSIASYGISTPNITVNQVDGAQMINTVDLGVSRNATIQYLHVSGNISGNGNGLYLQGPVYVDGRQI